MELTSRSELDEAEGLVPVDFTEDYRRSGTLRSVGLPLPDRSVVLGAVAARLAVPDDVIDQALTALTRGQHLLLHGPPGTGKTTLAIAITQALRCEALQVTASGDWTSFETVGGLQLVLKDGRESLEPKPGVITEAVVKCLNHIAAELAGDPTDSVATWLIIDELNRSNIDLALGGYFTALDFDHASVRLPFMDEWRREIIVPTRFRVIGTMNTYDKNFLFRLSYALTRRFALIEVGVPDNDDTDGRRRERDQILMATSQLVSARVAEKSVEEIETQYGELLEVLYEKLVHQIRSTEGLGRGIGFAQIASSFQQAVLACELGYVDGPNDESKKVAALDRGVMTSIVPQLEGLPNTRLQSFISWWKGTDDVSSLTRSIKATEALITGLELFVTEE